MADDDKKTTAKAKAPAKKAAAKPATKTAAKAKVTAKKADAKPAAKSAAAKLKAAAKSVTKVAAKAKPAAKKAAAAPAKAAKKTAAKPAAKSAAKKATKAAKPSAPVAVDEQKELRKLVLNVPGSEDAQYFCGVGRRKRAVAVVRLYSTKGHREITINRRPIDEALSVKAWVATALYPLEVSGQLEDVSIVAKTTGGGQHGQAGAISLGLSRALVKLNPEFKKPLREAGLLTRDSRARESKQYGLKRARKAPQYSKR